MNTKRNYPQSIEQATMELWLKQGSVTVKEIGSENVYLVNEFDHRFYCKPDGDTVEILRSLCSGESELI